ncbi:PspC domain-containing protein [Nocardioides sp. ChNu-153]|uniref:PspC domain-containing protein n=1 Tax=unclassified Nocardioides TaxID=2615069 RepID=UPI0024075FC5|nr:MULTISPECIES: PspC domain-containing protein [unclassified Nocardioides]MDF9716966.1 PspC domain-containing protein [Nocardioides sp. ChNu-99]MDN7121385.1 PspC domain-containing protein [Nocardioides sp. ChNu-153]
MTTTHDEAPASPGGPRPGDAHDHGPRVTGAQVRDLRRLRRCRDDRYVAGVAGGLARHLDLDPLVLRVALAVLVLFGGSGLLLYGALWLLVPSDDTEEAVVPLDDRSRAVALAVAGALAALALLGDLVEGWVPWPLLLVLLVVALVVGGHQRRSTARTPGSGPATTTGTPYPGTHPGGDAAAGHPPYPSVPRYVAPQRPRNPLRRGPLLFWFTGALVTFGVGLLALVDVAGLAVTPSAYPALALAVVGTMLVVGAFYGRAGGLVLVGLVLAGVTAVTAAAEEASAGERVVVPSGADGVQDRYRQGAGDLRVDLSGVRDADRLAGRTVRIEAGAGRVEVVLPAGLDAEVFVDVGLGGADVLGRVEDGPGVQLREAHDAPGTTPGVRTEEALGLDISLGLGDVVVVTP